MKVVINACYGGFSISRAAAEFMAERGHATAAAELAEWREKDAAIKTFLATGAWPEGIDAREAEMLSIDARYKGERRFFGYGYVTGAEGYRRDDPLLVAAVEALGDKSNGEHAKLAVVEIPDGVEWEIDEYDGNEQVAEKHRTWR